jgi:hypothetical protein
MGADVGGGELRDINNFFRNDLVEIYTCFFYSCVI